MYNLLRFCDKLLKRLWCLFVLAGLGGGLGVLCTVNPLHDGLNALARRQRPSGILGPLTVTIRPFRLAVMELPS